AVLLGAGPAECHGARAVSIDSLHQLVPSGPWPGRPNVLSPDHRRWPAIDVAAQAAWRSGGSTSADIKVAGAQELARPAFFGNGSSESARFLAVSLIQQRRSAVAFDDLTSIPNRTFYRMLDRLLPRSGIAPWDVLPC